MRGVIDAILDQPGGRGAVPVALLDHFTALTGRGWPEPAWRGVIAVHHLQPREVMAAAALRGGGVEGGDFPEWLLSDPETWALSYEWVGAPVPSRRARAA